MTYFIMQFLNGLQIGSIYALIALGYTMVYGIIKLINFAHGEIIMTAAYLSISFMTKWCFLLWHFGNLIIGCHRCPDRKNL